MIEHIDHMVLTVKNIDRTCDFYTKVLGMKVITFAGGRKALTFGKQKINLHQHGKEFEPKAWAVQPGSADICFITQKPIDEATQYIINAGGAIIEGPVERTGATGAIMSIYLRDPDNNLLEIANYL